MPDSDLIGFGLYVLYLVMAGLPMILLKIFNRLSFEVARKTYHMVITLSIFPLLNLFTTWYTAVISALILAAVLYPVLKWLEGTAFYQRVAVERAAGEFKSSLLIVQFTLAALIFIFWGLLGEDWKYIALVAVMAWGFGDAAAALVGKAFGRNPIRHRWLEGKKTFEGTFAMYIVAALAIFFTLSLSADHSWQVSFLVAILVAPVGAVVELFSRRGLDTLTVPLALGFSLLLTMQFLSFIGIIT